MGLVLALGYFGVLAVTAQVADRPLRPLFDGFAPPEPYRWVEPPPELARDNREPRPAREEVLLGDLTAGGAIVTTPDAQAVVFFGPGSLPSHGSDSAVRISVDPLDAATLGPLPDGLRPASNAYRLQMSYLPSGAEIDRVNSGSIALSSPAAGEAILYSADGTVWERLPSEPYGPQNDLSASVDRAGFFVVAVTHGSGETGDPANWILILALASLPVACLVLLFRPRRSLP